MDIKDLIVTPILLLGIIFFASKYAGKYDVRIQRYFYLSLSFKIVSAILLGVLYQYYYQGGDTYYYFYHSGIFREAFLNHPLVALQILFDRANPEGDAYDYISRMFWYHDPSALFVGKFAGIFDLITFHTYSATALFFALFSFASAWKLFLFLRKEFPHNDAALFISIHFVPSVIFWGSGLLKDSLSLSALFWIVYTVAYWIKTRDFKYIDIVLFIFALIVLKTVKIYILLCLLPVIALWLIRRFLIPRNVVLKFITLPVIASLFLVLSFMGVRFFLSEESKYSMNKLTESIAITANDIGHWSGRNAGSGYSFGVLDGSTDQLINFMHLSILTALFRPFIWEVNNPLMLLASLESGILILLTIYSLWSGRLVNNLKDPFLGSFFIFVLMMAFAVGFSYNFGTLMRYRIPILTFLLLNLLIKRKPVNVIA
jgi:hypothetical protein